MFISQRILLLYLGILCTSCTMFIINK